MLATCTTFSLLGIDPVEVSVEVDVRRGLPSFTVVGLGDAAVRESRERVRSALVNSGFEFPASRIVANLAPASLRKAGPGFDAALAAALLVASGQVPPLALDGTAVFGELSLGGEMKQCRGTLAVAEGARRAGVHRLLVAESAGGEAALVSGLAVGAVRDLRELGDVLSGSSPMRRPVVCTGDAGTGSSGDLSDVRGQSAAVEALQVAAAGGHNLLLEGPPGVGKTMLARRLTGLLPPLSETEALEVTRIHSVAGLHGGDGLVLGRPFRAPHHSVSQAGLIGGGSVPTPGEVTLAHRGVLFLDELSEFPRSVLDSLRQPLEDRSVSVVRRAGRVVFPASVTLVGATNPCPCGRLGLADGCHCDQRALDAHRRRLSGPLLDRFDLVVRMGVPDPAQFDGVVGLPTSVAAARVVDARQRQADRAQSGAAAINALASADQLLDGAGFTSGAVGVLGEAYARGLIGPRGRIRVMRVARTLADLSGLDAVDSDQVLGALSFRIGAEGVE